MLASPGLLFFWTDAGSGKNAIYSRPFGVDGIPSGSPTALTDGTTDRYVWSVAQVPQGYVVAGKILIPVDSNGLPSGNPVPSEPQTYFCCDAVGQVQLDKYLDHIPLAHQERILGRHGLG